MTDTDNTDGRDADRGSRRERSGDRGSVAVLGALAMLPLLGLLAVVIGAVPAHIAAHRVPRDELRVEAGSYAARLRALLLHLHDESEGLHVVEHVLLRPLAAGVRGHPWVAGDFHPLRLTAVMPAWTVRTRQEGFRKLAEEAADAVVSRLGENAAAWTGDALLPGAVASRRRRIGDCAGAALGLNGGGLDPSGTRRVHDRARRARQSDLIAARCDSERFAGMVVMRCEVGAV